jgi:hypothetical protein
MEEAMETKTGPPLNRKAPKIFAIIAQAQRHSPGSEPDADPPANPLR